MRDEREESVGGLIKDISEDVSTLVRKEVELAKIEMTEILKTKLRAAALGVAGLMLALLVLPLLILTVIETLAVWLPRWAASGIATLTALVLALFAFLGAKRFLDSKFLPEQTIGSIRKDVEWAKSLKKR